MKSFLRIWQEVDLEEVTNNLFVMGELSGECFSCHKVGISGKAMQCPDCKKEFKYVAFRRRIDVNSIKRFKAMYPQAYLIEFEDFKKALSTKHARKLLDI